MLERIEGLFRKFNCDYSEFRHETVFSNSISLRDKETSVSSGETQGYCARMLVKGSWGFASSDNPMRLEDVFSKAYRMAKISKGGSRVRASSCSGNVRMKAKKALGDVSIEERMADARELMDNLSGKGVTNRAVRYSDSVSKDVFMNSEGARTEQTFSRVYASFTSVAKSGSLMQRASERIGVTGGYEAIEPCFGLAQECPRRALALLSASPAPPGKHTVIIDGRMTGLLCHEALGHACEADSVLAGGSILRGRLGTDIGSELVSVTDDPRMPDAFGSYAFDDEGTGAKGTTLVDRGRLVSFLQSEETCAKQKAEPTGNARAQSFAFTPIVRMSNTCMKPGESEVEELFEGVENGVYARGMSGGVVDTTTGYFVFGAEDGFLVENGRKTRMLRDILLSGSILETLKNVDMVADDFLGSPGFCGKGGQSVPVSDGGPHVRVKGLMVGGSNAKQE